mmetsp:Transcript_59778/g.172511  ORF Transcript_59778/g.172511 Transcript_59778/m.172511 type:complete len:291 (-) Transcript_59778:97-969(-)
MRRHAGHNRLRAAAAEDGVLVRRARGREVPEDAAGEHLHRRRCEMPLHGPQDDLDASPHHDLLLVGRAVGRELAQGPQARILHAGGIRVGRKRPQRSLDAAELRDLGLALRVASRGVAEHFAAHLLQSRFSRRPRQGHQQRLEATTAQERMDVLRVPIAQPLDRAGAAELKLANLGMRDHGAHHGLHAAAQRDLILLLPLLLRQLLEDASATSGLRLDAIDRRCHTCDDSRDRLVTRQRNVAGVRRRLRLLLRGSTAAAADHGGTALSHRLALRAQPADIRPWRDGGHRS